MHKLVLLAIVAVLLGACGPYTYDHPRASQQQWLQDRYVCVLVASGFSQSEARAIWNEQGGGFSSATRPSCAVFSNCLAAKGYTAYPTSGQGRFKIPAGGGIQCTS